MPRATGTRFVALTAQSRARRFCAHLLHTARDTASRQATAPRIKGHLSVRHSSFRPTPIPPHPFAALRRPNRHIRALPAHMPALRNSPASRASRKPGEAHMRLLPALFTIRRRAARVRTGGRRRSGRRPDRASRGAPGSRCPWHRGSGS